MSPILANDELVHSSPKVVFFDKDGTLVDIHHYWVSMIKIRANFISKKWVTKTTDLNLYSDKLIDAMGVNLVTDRIKHNGPVGVKPRSYIVHIAADIVRKEGCYITDEEMELLFMEVDQVTSGNLLSLVKILPGVKKLLCQLKECGIQSIVVSNDITERAKKALEAIKIDHMFVEIIGSDSVSNSKPAPDLIKLGLSRIGINASEAVVIGDHPVDIMMGINSGISANIGVLNGISEKTAFSKYDCHVVNELSSILVEA